MHVDHNPRSIDPRELGIDLPKGYMRPGVIRDKRGRVRWQIDEYSEEENTQSAINNIRFLFLQSFPEFDNLFPKNDTGIILEEYKDEAKRFIVDRIGSRDKFTRVIGATPICQKNIFEASLNVALDQSFRAWGVDFAFKNAPPGWITNRALQKKTQKHEGTVRSVANKHRKEHPEWFQVYLDSSNKQREHYAPDLVTSIKKTFEQYTYTPVDWLPVSRLTRQLGYYYEGIRRIAELTRETHPEWFRQHRTKAGIREVYSPELVNLIKEQVTANQPPSEGWLVLRQLARQLKRSPQTVKEIAYRIGQNHPEWIKGVQGSGGTQLHYAPELIEEVKRKEQEENVFANQALQFAPEGWLTNSGLAKLLGIHFNNAKKIAERFRESQPGSFQIYFDSKGRPREHYSSDLVETIKKIIDRRNHFSSRC